MDLSDSLKNYAILHLDKANNWYSWRQINSEKLPLGLILTPTLNQYHQNITLKKQLSSKYHSSDKSEQLALTKYYISTWGGIHGNSPETIKYYSWSTPNELKSRGIKGIASWSKALVLRDPSQYAIYDARVAFSLNFLQIGYQVNTPSLFPLLASRNTQAGKWKQRIISRANKWNRVGDGFYTIYLELLRDVSKKLDCEISTLEMLLFSMVDDLFMKASQIP